MSALNISSRFAVSDGDPGASVIARIDYSIQHIFVFSTLILALLVLELFMHSQVSRVLTSKLPESCILVLVGVIVASVAYFTDEFDPINKNISPNALFFYLLPPIILDSAYKLCSKYFVFNMDVILLFALVGTLLNWLAIGTSIFVSYGLRYDMNFTICLLLSSILTAIDPVAVLAIFSDLGVQPNLYFVIFGESLLNDAITIVLFEVLLTLTSVDDVSSATMGFSFLAFIIKALGSILLGLVFGACSALLSRVKLPSLTLLEPILLLVVAYQTFITVEFFDWSGILGILACGLVQKRYAFNNITEDSRIYVEKTIHLLAVVSESIVFLVFGFKVLDSAVEWDAELIILSILFCFIFRFAVSFPLGWLVNRSRLRQLTPKNLFMVAFGGIRGAITFIMATTVSEDNRYYHKFLGVALSVILFTVWVQGSTVRYLVNLFNLSEVIDEDYPFTVVTTEHVAFHILSGMEAIQGRKGPSIHKCIDDASIFERRYITPLLCSETQSRAHSLKDLFIQGQGRFWGQNQLLRGKLLTDEQSHWPEPYTRGRKELLDVLKRTIKAEVNYPPSTRDYVDEGLSSAHQKKRKLINLAMSLHSQQRQT